MSKDTGGFLHCQDKYFKSLSWAEYLNLLTKTVNELFKFSIQDSNLEYLSLQCKNSPVSSDFKPPLGTYMLYGIHKNLKPLCNFSM